MSSTHAGVMLAGETNAGLVRRGNEDNFCVISPRAGKPAFAVIADGVGGHTNGALASYICCRDLASAFLKAEPESLASPLVAAEFFRGVVKQVNAKIFRFNLSRRLARPMGTTLVGVLVYPDMVVMVNVGDSRCYSWEAGAGLRQRSTDHNLRTELRREIRRRIKVDVAVAGNIICRAVGPRSELKLELKLLPRSPDSRWLLCSDGVYREIADGDLSRFVAAAATPREAVGAIMREALLRGARDNLTAVGIFPENSGEKER